MNELKTSYGQPYEKFIESEDWKKERGGKVARANGICEKCGWPLGYKIPECHHESYDNLGHEKETDTKVMHPSCHERKHKIFKGGDRYGRRGWNEV